LGRSATEKNFVVKMFLNYFKLSLKLSRCIRSIVIEATENATKLLVKQLVYVGGRLVRRFGWKWFGWVEVSILQTIQH
jgi:hypothetical protein